LTVLAISVMVRGTLRCSRQRRTSPLSFFMACLLIAGRNEVNFTPALDRAARAWNVNPRNVNEVFG
jgi:hypothetical protein